MTGYFLDATLSSRAWGVGSGLRDTVSIRIRIAYGYGAELTVVNFCTNLISENWAYRRSYTLPYPSLFNIFVLDRSSVCSRHLYRRIFSPKVLYPPQKTASICRRNRAVEIKRHIFVLWEGVLFFCWWCFILWTDSCIVYYNFGNFRKKTLQLAIVMN